MFIHVKSHKTEPVSADTLNLHECVEYLESFFFAWDPRWNRYDQKTVTFKSKINEIKIYAEKRSLADDLWLWDFCHKNVPLWTISDYEIFHDLSLFDCLETKYHILDPSSTITTIYKNAVDVKIKTRELCIAARAGDDRPSDVILLAIRSISKLDKCKQYSWTTLTKGLNTPTCHAKSIRVLLR